MSPRLLCLALLCLSPRARALDDAPLVRAWQTEHCLPGNTVHAIAQTPDGFLWLGTRAGLARFDGARFVTYGLREGLPLLLIRGLFVRRDGSLWISGQEGGLARMHEGAITSFTEKNGLPSNEVRTFAEGADGTFWVGTSRGVVRWEKDRFVPLPLPPGRYRFEVAAAAIDGGWSARPAAVGLILHPHFWQTRWFYTACALASLLAVAGAVRAVVKKRAARELARLEQRHAVDAERAHRERPARRPRREPHADRALQRAGAKRSRPARAGRGASRTDFHDRAKQHARAR